MNVNARGKKFGKTALHRAAENGHKDIVEMLLTAGADVNIKAKMGRSPLHNIAMNDIGVLLRDSGTDLQAVTEDLQNIIGLLCNAGADLNAMDDEGLSPLHVAVSVQRQGRAEMVKLLLNAGVNVNTKTKDGITPLHMAVLDGRKDLVELLLNGGADTHVKDARGLTPLECATLKDDKDIAELLRPWWTLRQLKSKDPSVRRRAAEELGNSRNKQAIRALVTALNDDHIYVRAAAQGALAKIGPAAVKPLTAALKDDREQVRWHAAWALGDTGDARAVEALLTALTDHTWGVRNAAAIALDSLNWQPADDTERALLAVARHDWPENVQEVIQLGSTAVEPLMTVLKGDRRDMQEHAAKALGEIGDARAVEPLVAALNAYDESTRKAAAEALGQIGDSRALEPLVMVLKDVYVKQAAVSALQQIDPDWKNSEAVKRAVPAFVTALRDESTVARRGGASVLGLIEEAQAVGPLVAALKDKESDVREEVVKALAQIGDMRALEPLVAMLKDEHYHVRQVTAEVLGKIGDARAVGPLLAALKTKQWNMAGKAAESLRKVLCNHVAQVGTEILREIAHLDNMVEVQKHYDINGNLEKTLTRPVDCSEVKQLARQELIRRGMEV